VVFRTEVGGESNRNIQRLAESEILKSLEGLAPSGERKQGWGVVDVSTLSEMEEHVSITSNAGIRGAGNT
jgi:hypothetical protein